MSLIRVEYCSSLTLAIRIVSFRSMSLVLSLLLMLIPASAASRPNAGSVAQVMNQIVAAKKVIEADRLFKQGTPESLRKSIGKYLEALALLQAAGNRKAEAVTLHQLGDVYDKLDEKHKALDYYNRALLIYEAIGDLEGQGKALVDTAAAYFDLGEKRTAITYATRGYSRIRAAGSRKNEAYALLGLGIGHDSLGERQKALDLYAQALPLWREAKNRQGE